jgi:predicted DNA-binding transcriptional regulator YafY
MIANIGGRNRSLLDSAMAKKTRPLGDWRKAPKRYLRDSDDPQVYRMIEAASGGELLEIVYSGGSQPGTSRQILPKTVYFAIGFGYYVEAYDYRRGEDRTFRLDRIRVLGGQASAQRPARPRRSGRSQPAPSTVRPVARSVSPKEKSGSSSIWYWIAGIIVLVIILS